MDKKEIQEQLKTESGLSKREASRIVRLFSKHKEKAKDILQDTKKVQHFLSRLERKCKKVPLIGEQLSYIPGMASLVQSYHNKEYPDLPLGAIMSIVGALLYFVSPIDVFPDGIPLLGYTDDAALIAVIWKLIGDDVSEYHRWMKENKK